MKSVLLIMPFFNSYHTIIKDEIEKMGYKVKVVRDSSFFVKLTHLRFLSERIYDFYMNTIWPILFKQRTKGEYDYLFVIKGQELTPALCDYLQNGCKTKNSILYLWDSIAHNPKTTKSWIILNIAILLMTQIAIKEFINLSIFHCFMLIYLMPLSKQGRGISGMISFA